MKQKSLLALGIAVAFGLVGCEQASKIAEPTPATTAAVVSLKSGIELTNLDTQVKPQQDFFRYVNGNWLAKTEIPADKSVWGSFHELRKGADDHVLTLIKAAAAKPAEAGTDQAKNW